MVSIKLCSKRTRATYQDHAAAPDVHFAARVQSVTNDQFRSCVAWTSAAGLHEISFAVAVGHDLIETLDFDEILVTEAQFLLFCELVAGLEGVGKAEIGYYDVSVSIQQQVLQLQIAVNDALLVQVSDSRYELGKQASRSIVFEISVIEDVVEELAPRRIFEHNAVVPFRFLHLV